MEKRLLIQRIEEELNDKRTYAFNKCISHMCSNEAYGRDKYGTVEEIQKVKMADVYAAWKNMLSTAVFQITVTGSADAEKIAARFPAVESIMIGRGLVADPGMLTGGTDRQTLKAFLTELSDTYCTVFGSKRNAIYRMKDNWHYLISLFEGSDKLWKEMRKSTDYDRFMSIANEIIETLPMREHPEISW
jgi:hypothetical protein